MSDSANPLPPEPGAPPPTPEAAHPEPGERRVVLWVLLLLVLIAALATCLWPRPQGFDYFRAKAEELGRDRARVLAYVKDELVTLPYRGDVKGALGTLWEGAGSPEEKLALAQALLAHCGGSGASLADVAPTATGSPAAPYQARITHRALLAEGEPRETEVWSGAIGDLVGNVHSVATLSSGSTEVVLRQAHPGGEAIRRVLPVGESIGEELVFRCERPEGGAREIVRELWRRGNRIGLDQTAVGDRHDFVVWPCRIGDYVREKEEELLRARGQAEGHSGQAYLALLDFAQQSDAEILAKVEARLGVRARFDQPRLLFLSRIEVEGQPAMALDLRQDDLEFTGAAADSWQAANARAWQEAAFEDRFLRDQWGVPVSSAWSLFQQLDDHAPNAPARRLQRIGRALAQLLSRPGVTRATFARAGEAPRVSARVVEGQLSLESEPVDPKVAQALRQAEERPRPWETRRPGAEPTPAADGETSTLTLPFDEEGRLRGRFGREQLSEAAVAVETCLLAALVEPPTSPSYLLDARLERLPELVSPGARFRFVQPGERGRSHEVEVQSVEDGLALSHVVRDGLSVVRGRKQITGEALAAARQHNPWYRRGSVTSAEATSFCVSRAVYRDLAAGQPARLGLLGKRELEEDGERRRQLAWEGELTPLGEGQAEVRVNGKPTQLSTLRVRRGEQELQLLADPRYPVGLVERLQEVEAGIALRIVDERGVGFSGVTVRLRDHELTTALDGWALLPPAPADAPYGAAEELRVVRVTQADEGPRELELGSVQADLSAPGLELVELKLARPQVDVRRIAPEARDELEELELSEQVKRHARRALEAGRTIAIPARMVETPFGERVAFFAHDPASGNLIGVSEDGLHGASSNWDDLRNQIQQELASTLQDNAEDLAKDGVHPIHMIRGFIVAWTVYATYRLRGMSHDQTVARMIEEMERWEQSSNLFTHVPDWVGDTEAGGLVSKVGNTNGPTSFYLGYLMALGFLHEELGR